MPLEALIKNCVQLSLQVTGEAEYVDDIAMPPHGLHAALVMSTKPHAKLVSIDPSEAENQPGFAGFSQRKTFRGTTTLVRLYTTRRCSPLQK